MRGTAAPSGSRFITDVAVTLLLVTGAAVVSELLHAFLGLTRLSVLFLAAVTVAASVRGGRASVIAALVGVVFYKIFLDLRTEDGSTLAEDVLNLLVFLIVALITSTLAGRMHDEAQRARRRADRMAVLLKASRALADEDDEDFWPLLARTLSDGSGTTARVFDQSGGLKGSAGDVAPDAELDEFVAKLIQDNSDGVQRTNRWSARPIRTHGTTIGILAWNSTHADSEINDLVELLAELASAAATRTIAREEKIRARTAEEASRLRETVLSSISHDFRSPLSAIIGSATSLLEYGDRFDASVKQDLLLNIRDEGEKLNDFVASLLDMSRLQAGVIQPAREQVSVDAVVSGAIDRLKRHKGQALKMNLAGACEATADPLLLEQAVYNVLDNAFKYAGSDGGVQIVCKSTDECCEIIVADHGPGLSEDEKSRVFNKFRGGGAAARTNSTGLGLFIAKGFVEAIGGSMRARDREDGARGLEMIITLPRAC